MGIGELASTQDKREVRERDDGNERRARVSLSLPFPSLRILEDLGAVSRVGRKGGAKVFKYGQKNPGYRLSPNYVQKFKQMQAPNWAQKMLCIIVPNRRTVSPELFS